MVNFLTVGLEVETFLLYTGSLNDLLSVLSTGFIFGDVRHVNDMVQPLEFVLHYHVGQGYTEPIGFLQNTFVEIFDGVLPEFSGASSK